jgi:hypothetical protein
MSMLGVEANESELRERLIEIVCATPPLMQVLSVARHLNLPDWLVFSGAVYQPVLNHFTGRPLDYGIKDYDLGYFDASDLSYDAEHAVIHRVKAAFDEPLRSMVEVRNQARVHIWFEAKFGEVYGPLSSTAEALERFASATFAVGVRLGMALGIAPSGALVAAGGPPLIRREGGTTFILPVQDPTARLAKLQPAPVSVSSRHPSQNRHSFWQNIVK